MRQRLTFKDDPCSCYPLDPPPPPLPFSRDNFDAAVTEFSPLLVEFYAPWCGHCKKLAPEFVKAAADLKADGYKIAKIDATEEKDLASRFSIQGFPTLKFFTSPTESTEYSGDRDAAGIAAFVRKKSGPATKTVETVAEVEALLKKSVVFIGIFNKGSPAVAVYEALAKTVDEVTFLVGDSAALREAYGVAADAEALVTVNTFEKQENKIVYSGDLADKAAVSAFILSNVMPLVIAFKPETVSKIFQGAVKQHYLLFVDPAADETKDIMITFRDLAGTAGGKLLFVSVDPAQDKVLEYFGVKKADMPAAAIVNMENEPMKKFIYDKAAYGPLAAESMKSFLNQYLNGALKTTLKSEPEPVQDLTSGVKVLVGNSFESMVLNGPEDFTLIEFYAPWCGHCKALAPIWEELGQSFKSSPHVGIMKMDYTLNEVDFAGVKVKGFPTVRYISRQQRL